MRKFIILVGALMLSLTSFAQSCDLYGTAFIQGGYNVLGKQPVIDLAIMGTFDFVRAKIEVGRSQITAPEIPEALDITYLSPSLGVAFGKKCDIYILAGAMPWGSLSEQGGTYTWRKDIWHPKFEAGVNIPLGCRIFLNFEAMYMLPVNHNYEKNLQNLTLRAGLGVDF